ncbi:hypothetical protein HOY82DRAFT_610621 [Tuber indicum]|nr:hypothetical protein HOY82DRAFT_610621 [Tuber indicum]
MPEKLRTLHGHYSRAPEVQALKECGSVSEDSFSDISDSEPCELFNKECENNEEAIMEKKLSNSGQSSTINTDSGPFPVTEFCTPLGHTGLPLSSFLLVIFVPIFVHVIILKLAPIPVVIFIFLVVILNPAPYPYLPSSLSSSSYSHSSSSRMGLNMSVMMRIRARASMGMGAGFRMTTRMRKMTTGMGASFRMMTWTNMGTNMTKRKELSGSPVCLRGVPIPTPP